MQCWKIIENSPHTSKIHFVSQTLAFSAQTNQNYLVFAQVFKSIHSFFQFSINKYLIIAKFVIIYKYFNDCKE